MTNISDADARIVARLVERIRPVLAGHPPNVQSAALADLTSMWLAGMQDIKNPESAELLTFRDDLFAEWCEMVRELVPINAAMIRNQLAAED